MRNGETPSAEQYDLWPVVEKETGQVVGHCGLLDKEIEGITEIELNYTSLPDRPEWYTMGPDCATLAAQAGQTWAAAHLASARDLERDLLCGAQRLCLAADAPRSAAVADRIRVLLAVAQ